MHDGKRRSKSHSDDELTGNDTYLPPRKAVHPSEKGVWTRRFYLTLIWLFILLTAALLAWGYRTGIR